MLTTTITTTNTTLNTINTIQTDTNDVCLLEEEEGAAVERTAVERALCRVIKRVRAAI